MVGLTHEQSLLPCLSDYRSDISVIFLQLDVRHLFADGCLQMDVRDVHRDLQIPPLLSTIKVPLFLVIRPISALDMFRCTNLVLHIKLY